MTVPLTLERPGWELLIVPGAWSEGPGVILRMHHAVADGAAAIGLMRRLFDVGPALERNQVPPQTFPLCRPRPWRTLVTGSARLLALFRATVPPTVLLGPIGPRRGVAFVEVDLGTLARAARARGATVNDALLAAATAATEAALRARDHPVPTVLPASVPVALPDRGSSGNAVGVMLVPLPVGESDPLVRLARIAAATTSAKAEARTQGTYELTRTRWGTRLFARLAKRQRFIALFVTNVRGPETPMSIDGAPLEQAWPVVPIQGNVRLGIAALSYAGRFGVTVHTDDQAVGADVAAQALGTELERISSGDTEPGVMS